MIYGRKLGMMRYFKEDGSAVPVTVVEVQPNIVFQVKTTDKEGYNAVQVGMDVQKVQRVNQAMSGHQSKAKSGFVKKLKEIRYLDKKVEELPKIGDTISLEGMFEVGQKIDVVGTSIGKGFAGVVKRHGMAGFKRTHGTHEYRRHGGSIGCRKFPGRVFKNKRMSGHMGNVRVMQRGLEVVSLRPDQNILLIKGSVPGSKNSFVYIRAERA